ncbi:MAG TPA: M1 family metallopeptidase [Longimicrobiales bacterium]|nr:M1 family metallopeptidase [Longimicrobiales bacterium]
MRGSGRVAPLLSLIVLTAACARTPAPAPPAPTARADTTRPTTAPEERYDIRPVPVPPAFELAVRKGTRTQTGQPGPRYWQQRVNYSIDAELDPKTARLNGEERVTYVNNSPDTLSGIVLHLYQNLFKAGAPRVEQTPVTGGMTLERVMVNGQAAKESNRPQPLTYRIDDTLMGLGFDKPLAPGDTARLEIAWHFTVPPAGAPRMGHVGRELFEIAQWYPQVAVYDDVNDWDTHPYLGRGEFYLEYGDFDVSLTLPEGYIVGATGTLQNPDEVLSDNVRRRLEAASAADTVVHVVRQGDFGAGTATQQVPGGELTWRFRARDVRDFAWATSSRYLWDATRAVTPDADGDGKPEHVLVQALFRPEARTWREAVRYAKHALTFHAEHWYPYVYPQMTVAEGPEGGMEYPMIVFVSAYSDPKELYSVLNHEIGHEWFPMMVGSNEHDFAWQDEGVNTYIENLATQDFFKSKNEFEDEMAEYVQVAGTDQEVEMMRNADLYGAYMGYGVASYFKPGVALRALGTVIGPDEVQKGLQAYAKRWFLKHPTPLDFFNTFDQVAGQDLSWFWYPWWYTTQTLDQAVAGVDTTPEGAGQRVAVRLEDRGGLPMPVLLRLTLANGQTQDVKVPASVWLPANRHYTETVSVAAPVQKVEIDPMELLPDVDRENNVWPRR